jgi:4-diphosphocytidyl-2-C-methyl-D-erythritol kinase
MAETEFAPAKVNLTLHVTGRRADGYHLLDSLVVFAGVGDRVSAELSDAASLVVTGPMAAGLSGEGDNLVLRAARLIGVPARIGLEKVLPVSSGIGGGSADAAATLRLLARLSGRAMPGAAEVLALGADVPVCLAGRAVRMTGIGEGLGAVPALPQAWLVLVNPMVAVSTPAVFKALARADNAPMPREVPKMRGAAELAAFLTMQRNDLEAPAMAVQPVIGRVKAALSAQAGCMVARMSGSGATCFGLFADPLAASAAARAIRAAEPGWWVADAPVMQA